MLAHPENSNHTESAASPTVSDPSATSAIQIYVIDRFRTRGGFVVAARCLEEDSV